MQSPLSVVSLAVAVVAAAVAGYAVVENRALRAELEAQSVLGREADLDGGSALSDEAVLERLEAVEQDVLRVEKVATTRAISGMPSLAGRERDAVAPGQPKTTDPLASPEATSRVEALVDEAVDKKARQFSRMQDKKPTLDAFAEVLELDEEQRARAAREIVRGQREIRSLLEIPADDGTVFLDELVETLAVGMAEPKEAQPRMMKLFGRLITEKVPGTNVTYAARAEAIKTTVREAFRADFSDAQFERFQAWQMDPTEVQGVEGSAWADLQQRILERARALGADVPADAGR